MDIIDFRTRPRTAFFYRNILPEPIPAFKRYFSHYHIDTRLTLAPLSESVKEMQSAGVSRGVIFPGSYEGVGEVLDVINEFPDTYIGMAEIDISKGVTKGVRDLERCYKEHGFKGMTLSPFLTGIYPTDPKYYPLYYLSEKMGKPVQIHSSTHFNPETPLDIGNPNHLDRIAMDFPDLKLVMGHAGIGFGSIGLTVANRHPNIYIDFTGLSPKYLPKEMVHAMNTYLKKRVIFGTNYPSLPYDVVEDWKDVIREENQEYFFYKNAARILDLEEINEDRNANRREIRIAP